MQKTTPLFWLAVAMSVLIFLSGVALSFVEKGTGKRTDPFFVQAPSALPVIETTQPTPTPTYTPHSVVLQQARQQFITAFLDAAIGKNPDPNQGDHLVRFENQNISARLRGQPLNEDEACFTQTIAELNSVMEKSQIIPTTDPRLANLEIYILPQNQFTSINPDSPAGNPSYAFFQAGQNFSLSSVNLLIDRDQSASYRCLLLKSRVLQLLGLPFYTFQENMGDVGPTFLTPEVKPYSEYQQELIRLLYSPYITSGLSREEIQRRLEL